MDNKIKRGTLLRLFVFVQFFLPLAGNAQTLNLYDAVDRAVKTYPQLQQRRAEVSAGRAHVTTVKGNALPSLMLQDQFDVGTNNTEQGAYFSLGIVPSTPGGSPTAKPNYNPSPVNIGLTALQCGVLQLWVLQSPAQRCTGAIGS